MLNPHLNLGRLHKAFGEKKRLLIRNALQDKIAERVLQYLEQEVPWELAYSDATGKGQVLSQQQLVALGQDGRARLQHQIVQHAREHYQFVYQRMALTAAYRSQRLRDTVLETLYEFLASWEFITCVRKITGRDDLNIIDAQACCYGPGHFLKRHNDFGHHAERRIAYVFNFSQNWQPDWGGLLHFLTEDGQIEESFLPTYNSLTLFQVPQDHLVSMVSSFTPARRYSITGWLKVADGD